MTTPKLQQWLYVELTTKTISDGTTNTYYLSNRPIIDDTNTGRYVPILKSVGSFGASMGDFLPTPIQGTIVIDNSPNSFGYERRFSDLFERETCITQTIKLYAAQTELTDLNVSADFVLAWQGTVLSYDINRNQLALRISTVGIPARELGKKITDTDFPSAPLSSGGQYLPLVFGYFAEVKPIRIDADADTSPAYAYAATMGTQFPNEGAVAHYAKAKNGAYQVITSSTSVSTSIAGITGTGTGGGENLGNNTEIICRFASASQLLGAITKVKPTLYYNSGSSSTVSFTFTIYEATDINGADPVSVYQTSTSVFTGGGLLHYDFYVTPTEPIVVISGRYYFLGIKTGTAAANPWNWSVDSAGSVPTSYNFSRDLTISAQTWTVATAQKHLMSVYRAKTTDYPDGSGTVNTTTGYGHSYFELTQNSSGSSYTDLTKLDLISAVTGIIDDTSGTITGTVSQRITSPQHAIKLLDKEWNGSTWTGGKFDWTRFSSTHTQLNSSSSRYYRYLLGSTQSRVTLEQFYEQICKESACRISLFNGSSNQLAVYAWGTNISSSVTISDEDILTDVSITQRGVETVVNRVNVFYRRSLLYADFAKAQVNNTFKNYVYSLDWSSATSAYLSYIIGNGATLFGTRLLSDITYDLLGDSQSAGVAAESILAIYKYPHTFISFEIPYFKFSTLDLLDVITIVHPDLPSYFGTSSNASLATYQGSQVDIMSGDYLKRASAYRAQIESREVVFDSNSIATIRLGARLLLNNPIDPT